MANNIIIHACIPSSFIHLLALLSLDLLLICLNFFFSSSSSSSSSSLPKATLINIPNHNGGGHFHLHSLRRRRSLEFGVAQIFTSFVLLEWHLGQGVPPTRPTTKPKARERKKRRKVNEGCASVCVFSILSLSLSLSPAQMICDWHVP